MRSLTLHLRFKTLFMTVLPCLFGWLIWFGTASSAHAVVIEQRHPVTYNMQGSTANGQSKWTTDVAPLLLNHDIVALQEAGGLPASATTVATAQVQIPSGGSYQFSQATWNVGSATRGNTYNVYHLETDPNGNRVNLAIVLGLGPGGVPLIADEWQVIFSSVNAGRPALCVRISLTWWCTVHALSGGGNDGRSLLSAINVYITGRSPLYYWTALGDWNRDPSTLITPLQTKTYSSGQSTQQSAGELDYGVSNDIVDCSTTGNQYKVVGNRLPAKSSDHYPVDLTLNDCDNHVPIPTTPSLRVMPLGDGNTVGPTFPSTLTQNAYRGVLQDDLTSRGNSWNFVGTQTSGNLAQNHFEAYNSISISDLDARLPYSAAYLRPNIVTLEVGNRDMAVGNTTDLSSQRLTTLIEDLFIGDPGVTVVVGTVVPTYSPSPDVTRVAAFNARIPGIVTKEQQRGRHILLADMSSILSVDVHYGDWLLYPSGYTKMASAFDTAVQTALNLNWVIPPVPCDYNGCGGGLNPRGNPALRLMPLGDSITHGYHSTSDDGYRGPLRSALVKDGFAADFVGDVQWGTMYDNYNEGFSGYRIDAIDSFVGAPVGKYQPNLITLMLGTNDMVQNTDLPNAPARMTKLLNDIYANDPSVTVLVATLIPSLDPVVQARIPAYNQSLPGVVQDQVNQGRHVALVDMGFFTTADLAPGDNLHPGDSGYQKLADAWHSAVQNAVSKGWVSDPTPCGSIPAGCNDSAITAGSEPAGTDPNAQQTGGGTPGGGSGGSSGRTNAKLRMADFDGDGKADYVGIDDVGAMTVWMNQGGGSWAPAKKVALGVAPGYQVQLADFDGDGKADYIVVHDDGTVRVLLNRGGDNNGGWDDLGQVAFGEGPAGQVRFADMDGDGKADYMIVGPGGSIDYWQNRGGDNRGGWGPDLHIAYGVAPNSEIQLVDFDGDGKADYVVVAADGSVQVWINRTGMGDPGGDWKWLHTVANGNLGFDGSHVLFADFNGDGRADYLGVGPGGSRNAWLNNGGDNQAINGWVPQGYIALGVGATGDQVRFADVNGDKFADYLVITDPKVGSVDVSINRGSSGNKWQWDPKIPFALGVGKAPNYGVLFGDVNGDGLADYMVGPPAGQTGIFWYEANGGSTSNGWKWTDQFRKNFFSNQDNVGDRYLLADLTGDNKAELIVIYGHSGGASALLNQVDPSSAKPDWTSTDPNTPYDIATGIGYQGNQVWIADFDNDGKADYIVMTETGQVQVLKNESGGGKWTWGKPTPVPGRIDCKSPVQLSPGGTTPDFTYIQFADIDGDGRADLLCIDRPNGAVRAWTNKDGTQPASANGWNSIGTVANGYVIVGLQ